MSGDLPRLPGHTLGLGHLPNATVSLWIGKPPKGVMKLRSVLAYMPTSAGDRFCGLVLMKGQNPEGATHLVDSAIVFEIAFHGVVNEKRRTIAVFELVRPPATPAAADGA